MNVITQPCSATRAEIDHDSIRDAQDVVYEQNWAEFKKAPYDYCEINESEFSFYDLLGIAVEYFASELGYDFTASPFAKKDVKAAIESAIRKLDH